MRPWNDWYHCMGNTYGTWLPGDARSFRTRHHREHIIGDYRHPPPPGMYQERLAQSKSLMSRAPVRLTPQQRRTVCDVFADSLVRRAIELVALSLDSHHFHLLARFPDHNPRHWLGVAKKESSHALTVAGLGVEGGIWAARSKCLLIRDRKHQLTAVRYILSHRWQGAAVWYLQGASRTDHSP